MINLSSVGHCLKWNNQSVSNYNRSVNLNRDSGWPGFSSARLFGDGGFCKENPSWLSPSFGQCLSRRFPVFVVKGTAASSICVFSVDILSRFWGLSKNLLFDFQKDDSMIDYDMRFLEVFLGTCSPFRILPKMVEIPSDFYWNFFFLCIQYLFLSLWALSHSVKMFVLRRFFEISLGIFESSCSW